MSLLWLLVPVLLLVVVWKGMPDDNNYKIAAYFGVWFLLAVIVVFLLDHYGMFKQP